MQQHRRFRHPILTALLTLALAHTAQASDYDALERAVQIAQQHITDRSYDLARECPAELAYLNDQPPCQHYTPSESVAYAVQRGDSGWRVYFRKLPAADGTQSEYFRVVEVCLHQDTPQPRAAVLDSEQYLPADATLLY